MAFAVLLNLHSATAQSSPDDALEENLISHGVELRREGDDAEALATFERAYALRHTARALAQIALAHQALGHWVDAEEHLVEALERTDDPWIAHQRVDLEESLSSIREHLASLDVQSNIAAEVWIGDRLAGQAPFDRPRLIPIGDLILDIRAAGYPAVHRTLHVEPMSVLHEAVTFVAPAREDRASRPPADITPRPQMSVQRKVGWATLGLSGALATIGGAGMITREWEALIYNSHSCDPIAGQLRSTRCKTNHDIGEVGWTVGLTAFIGAGITAGASALLLLGGTPPRASKSSASAAPSVACAPAGLGLSCGGTF
jgi:hypothetical protein